MPSIISKIKAPAAKKQLKWWAPRNHDPPPSNAAPISSPEAPRARGNTYAPLPPIGYGRSQEAVCDPYFIGRPMPTTRPKFGRSSGIGRGGEFDYQGPTPIGRKRSAGFGEKKDTETTTRATITICHISPYRLQTALTGGGRQTAFGANPLPVAVRCSALGQPPRYRRYYSRADDALGCKG
jgi:hypothetical protein